MARSSGSVEQLLMRARAHAKKGEFAEARSLYQSVLDRFPRNKRALQGLQQLAQAAIPPHVRTQRDQVLKLFAAGRTNEAYALGQPLFAQLPDDVELANVLGAIAVEKKQLDAATAYFTAATRLLPNAAQAYLNLAIVLFNRKRYGQAAKVFQRAIEIDGKLIRAHVGLGQSLERSGRPAESVAAFRAAREIAPNDLEVLIGLASGLRKIGRAAEAVETYKQALALHPDNARLHAGLASAYRGLGDKASAAAELERALELDPTRTATYLDLATLGKIKPGDPLIDRLRQRQKDGNLNDLQRAHIGFALAKALEDAGDIDGAFAQYLEGNAARKKALGYTLEKDTRKLDLMRKLFDGREVPMLERDACLAEARPRPIFILGMPRSGTTLTEQILAAHSDVHAAGELGALNHLTLPILRQASKDADYVPTADEIARLREGYFSDIADLGIESPVFTDKMPLNFRFIGLIVAAMPEASIVHLQRDPMAVCWSIFKRYFGSDGNGYAYDMEDLASFYGEYRRLMQFWDERFPGRIFHLPYERLTEEQEPMSRALVAACGLEWQDACLDFHKAKRSVATASSLQVREKMYKGSSEAWHAFERHLKPLQDALARELAEPA